MRTIVKVLFLISFILLSVSCISELEDMENADNIERMSAQMHTKSVTRLRSVEAKTFSRLPNPYALANMQRVYDDCGVNVELEPTDVYVKFMPSDSTQLRRLYDCGFELFDHPLDIELEAGDVYYNDSIPEGTLTYLYTTIKPNVKLESFGVPYEHLEDCYIPEDGEVIECEDPQTKAPVYVDVEIAAFSNLGYVLENSGRASMANPQGNIKVRDNTAAMDVPVKGAKVRCHRFVKWASAYTDSLGNYVIDKKFRYKPYYSVVFTNEKGFDIWGSYGPIAKASYNMGQDYNVGHSEIIDETNNAWEWAAINNAAYEYYEICKNDSIVSPPSGLKIWSWKFTKKSSAPMLDKMMESAKESCAQSFFDRSFDENTAWIIVSILQFFLPDVTIGSKGSDYGDIYRTVCHELAHASHFAQVGCYFWEDYINYIINNWGYGYGTKGNAQLCAVGEMWGYAVGHLLYSEKYYMNGMKYPGDKVNDWICPHVFWDLVKKKH